jgi:N-glycosylase/DNA lyase
MNTSNEEAFITQIDQDVVENIFSFICSQNNNISRISSLVEKLCTHFGEKITEYNGRDYFAFPTLEALNKDEEMESKLRELGFGYRAKYIGTSAKQIIEKGGLKWLKEIQSLEYHDAHSQLLTLNGIGPKVGDCICLMSFNFLQAIPVDTHIIQIAQHYVPEISSKLKSMNLTTYRKIGDAFRKVYGDKAGMAQTVLFCKELDKFKEDKPNKKMKKQ